jgi:transcriptional regulator with XRE-family HTH domain
VPRTAKPQFVEFGRRLRAIREAHNVTVPWLSQRTGISQNALYNYEAGRRIPSPVGNDSDGDKLCKALNIEMNWLYRADERWLTLQLADTLRAHLDGLEESYIIEATPKAHKRRRPPR